MKLRINIAKLVLKKKTIKDDVVESEISYMSFEKSFNFILIAKPDDNDNVEVTFLFHTRLIEQKKEAIKIARKANN